MEADVSTVVERCRVCERRGPVYCWFVVYLLASLVSSSGVIDWVYLYWGFIISLLRYSKSACEAPQLYKLVPSTGATFLRVSLLPTNLLRIDGKVRSGKEGNEDEQDGSEERKRGERECKRGVFPSTSGARIWRLSSARESRLSSLVDFQFSPQDLAKRFGKNSAKSVHLHFPPPTVVLSRSQLPWCRFLPGRSSSRTPSCKLCSTASLPCVDCLVVIGLSPLLLHLPPPILDGA